MAMHRAVDKGVNVSCICRDAVELVILVVVREKVQRVVVPIVDSCSCCGSGTVSSHSCRF